MRTKENRIRRAFFVSGLCLALILFAAPAAQAEADPAGVTADRNGIPVVRLTIDPEELQKVNESPDHSYRAREGRVRIEIPQGYEGEFGEIDPETLKADLPLNYIRISIASAKRQIIPEKVCLIQISFSAFSGISEQKQDFLSQFFSSQRPGKPYFLRR